MYKALILLISLIALTSYVKAEAKISFYPGHYHYRELSPACEQFGKSKLSRWDVDTTQELVVLINACRGNGDGSCIKTITAPLARWDFDSLAEFAPLALTCRGSNTECIRWVKRKISSFDFNDPIEVGLVAQACFATDMHCVESICAADRWACDDKHEYLQITRTCSSPRK